MTDTSPHDGDIEVVLDLSRLLSRILHAMPTGVDRVEMAYALTLRERLGSRLAFAAVTPFGRYGRLDTVQVLAFLDRTQHRWSSSGNRRWLTKRLQAARDLLLLRPRRVPPTSPTKRRYYVQASPHHLTQPKVVANKLRREKAPLVCLVHDLIPIEYPEYARPNGAMLHKRRMETMLAFSGGLIANSHATALSVQRYAAERPQPPIRVAHLGASTPTINEMRVNLSTVIPSKPYFVVVSTIEPRKNHILLLNIWRRMVETCNGETTPHLVIIGRRGWENENVVDMLERCAALQDHVSEYSGLSDAAVHALLRGARALLMPSFAEGFGMPVSEALGLGIPVICSDLPSLREAGCDIPDYLDPLDGPAWIKSIRDYCKDGSHARAGQLLRIQNWREPSWDDHIDVVLGLIAEIDAGTRTNA